MKTNIRFLVMIAVSLLTVLGMSAQEPFFLHKEGVKLTYADKDKKGKINSYTETTATKVTGDADNCTVTYSMMVMDNKKNPVLKQPMTHIRGEEWHGDLRSHVVGRTDHGGHASNRDRNTLPTSLQCQGRRYLRRLYHHLELGRHQDQYGGDGREGRGRGNPRRERDEYRLRRD